MTDHSELKRLAEAAPKGPWFGPEYAPGTSYVFDVDLGTLLEYQSIDSEKDACLCYVAAANPASVLALIAENERLKNSKPEITQDMVDEFRQGQSQGESLNTSLLRVLRACPGRGAADYWKAEHLAGNSRLHEVAVACATAEQERDQLKAENEALRKDSERINFIESQNHRTLRFYKKRWSFEGFTNYEYSVFKSLREAIDSAMGVKKK